MNSPVDKLRVATYNVHRCRGLDRRVRPARIVKVLSELNADIVALQEVWGREGTSREADQVRFIAEELGLSSSLGENRRLRGSPYGNVVLSRFPVNLARNYDITVKGCEKRGCLRVDICLNDSQMLHVFNVHLGTALLERRSQGRKLIAADILTSAELEGPRVVLGDFNEWTRGLVSRLLSAHFESPDLRTHLRRSRTYPGVLPFMHLDHIYFDRNLTLEKLTLHRSRTALIASDHLPLVADFGVPRSPAGENHPGQG